MSYREIFTNFKSNQTKLYEFKKKYDELTLEVSRLHHILESSKKFVRDSDVVMFDKRLEEESWLQQAYNLFISLERWKAASITPVSVGIMGRMSVGKTTVLMELLDPPDDSPIRKMPARKQETTACAVRWGELNSINDRFQLGFDQILLKLRATKDSDEDILVNLEGYEELLGSSSIIHSHYGLEVTAHPPQNSALLLRSTRTESQVIKIKGPKKPNDITLEDIAKRSRLAVIPSRSKVLSHEEASSEQYVFLNFLDLIDFPGADAVNARAEVKDKAQAVFESNTHECDLMLFVIGLEAGSQNLGAQIKDIVWIHWALRCILAGNEVYQRELATAVTSSYAKYDQLRELADFLDDSEGDNIITGELADKLADHMNDAEEFWSWMAEQKEFKNALLYEHFYFHLNQALSRNSHLASIAIEHDRLAFLINYGGRLLDGSYGFSRGADAGFWASFVETTLNATSGAVEAFLNEVWPRFFLVDLPASLMQQGLVYNKDIDLAKKYLFACYDPNHPYVISEEQEEQLVVWMRQVHHQHLQDYQLKELIESQRADESTQDIHKFILNDNILMKIHDLAQSWWWSSSFQQLSSETREDIYRWTIESALDLVKSDEDQLPRGGYNLLRQRLVFASSGAAFERKIKEASDRYQQALIRAQSLFAKIFRSQIGMAEVGRLQRWGEACSKWPYWSRGSGVVITNHLIDTLKTYRNNSLSDFKENVITQSVKVAFQQMLMKIQTELEEGDQNAFESWVTDTLLDDLTLMLYAESHLVGGRQQHLKRGVEFIHAVFIRLEVLLTWLTSSYKFEDELLKALDSMDIQQDMMILKSAVEQSRSSENFTFKLLSNTPEEI